MNLAVLQMLLSAVAFFTFVMAVRTGVTTSEAKAGKRVAENVGRARPQEGLAAAR